MNSLYLKIFLAIISISFLGGIAIAQHSLELKKSVVFQQEPIDYYLQVDSAYLNTPHYVLWVDPVENKIIDFNIHIPFAPVSKGSFYIDENWKRYGEFILFALPKVAPNTIAYAHMDVLPNKAELLEEWKKLSTSNRTSWEKLNHAEGDITFQVGPKLSQAPVIESSMLSATLIENNWEIIIEKPESVENFTLQFSQKDSVLFAANSTSEQQRVIIPARRLPPGELNITLLSDGEEIDLLTIQNPLIAISESDINFQKLNDTLGQFELTQLINPWVDLKDFSLKVSITDFPELLMNEDFTDEISSSIKGFEENTITVFYAHEEGQKAVNEIIVVINKENELHYTTDQDGKYFFDQLDFTLLDNDYHFVTHKIIQGDIEVDVIYPDIEIIRNQLPEFLSQIPTRISVMQNKKVFNFNLESTGVLLDEINITAKRRRNTRNDTREISNSINNRGRNWMCAGMVINCTIHPPYEGGIADPSVFGEHSNYERTYSYNLYVRSPRTPSKKARIRNIQEHFFKDEAIFGFYSDMISQAYAPLSLLYTSEIELPGVYSNAYFIVEVIHKPTGMRQQVVKKILSTSE
ncbi:hypothetical protein ACFCT7_07295 [Fulvivirgaceae bacterium LMO-SS25]